MEEEEENCIMEVEEKYLLKATSVEKPAKEHTAVIQEKSVPSDRVYVFVIHYSALRVATLRTGGKISSYSVGKF